MNPDKVTATQTIPAPAPALFTLLANPATHAAIDGTGWVQEPVDRARLTQVGQVFRMGMYHPDHPLGVYQVANQVHVLDPPCAIGWRTGEEKEGGHLEFGGWTWRYDLVPLGPSESGVRLTYDWSAVPASIREYLRFPPFGAGHLADSLRHLAALATDG